MADEPTGFIASYGQGKPVIAILGEFEALPGLSQQTVAQRDPVVSGAAGHGCGHNLLGAGAALAAVSVKEYMVKNHVAGTLRYYGTPAEEGGSGKVYMVRDGLFKNVDVVLHWHPLDRNSVINGGMLAVTSAKFTFHGVASHAAMAPDRGALCARCRDADGQWSGVYARACAEQYACAQCDQQGRRCAECGAGSGEDGLDGA